MPEVKPWDSYALAVETKGRLPNVHGPKRTRMSDGRRRKKTKDAIFFIYPLDKQQVGQANASRAVGCKPLLASALDFASHNP